MAEPDFDDVAKSVRENRTLLERLSSLALGPPPGRPLVQELTDDERKARIAATMSAFLAHREAYVRSLLLREPVSPETSYALSEAIHAYFRHRQILLSSDELRQLSAPIIERWVSESKSLPVDLKPTEANEPHATAAALPLEAAGDDANREEPPPREIEPPVKAPATMPAPIAAVDYLRVVHDATAEPAPPIASAATIVSVAAFQSRLEPHTDQANGDDSSAASKSGAASTPADQQDVLVARCMALVAGAVDLRSARNDRPGVLAAIDAALGQMNRELTQPMSGETYVNLYKIVASETLGLGVIGQIWEDASVQSIFVNDAHSIFVEREGAITPAAAQFRDNAHLLSFIARIGVDADKVASEVRLRNGGKCIAIFPPASPSGPIFTFHRGTMAGATLSDLVAADMIDDRLVSLLRLAATAGLTTAIVGPAKSGKTTLLAALCADLGDKKRVVTLSRTRELASSQPGCVELVASDAAPLSTLLHYALQICPEVLAVDGAGSDDINALADLDRSTMKGVVLVLDEGDKSKEGPGSADIVVRMGWNRDAQLCVLLVHDARGEPVFAYVDGRFKLMNPRPAFTAKVSTTDHAAAFADLLS